MTQSTDSNLSYKQYANTNLFDKNNYPKHRYDEETSNLFDKYLHLNSDEYNKLKTFAIENKLEYDSKNLKYEIQFDTTNRDLSLKMFDLQRIVPNLSTSTTYTKNAVTYNIHLRRFSWNYASDNIKLLKQWYNK